MTLDCQQMILSKPRLLRRAQLNGVSKGGEHPLWSRAGFKPRSRIQLISPDFTKACDFVTNLLDEFYPTVLSS